MALLVYCVAFGGCDSVLPEKPVSVPQAPRTDIDLSGLRQDARYIDLSRFSRDTIYLTGHYTGDRIVFRGARGKVVVLWGAKVTTTHAEDAIAVDGDAVNFSIIAYHGATLEKGGLTFWARLESVNILGLTVRDGHTGIRATRDLPHRYVTIEQCNISNMSHEGIYIGPSKRSPNFGSGLVIKDCNISDTGWDGIQAGNYKNANLLGNKIDKAGTAKAFGQDYAITLNYGGLYFLAGNTVTNSPKILQSLSEDDTRTFIHEQD